MIDQLGILFLYVSAILSLLFPLILFVLWKKKLVIHTKPVIVGALTFFVFSQVLEKAVHFLVLGRDLSSPIMHNPLQLMLYGGFMAGIFEETGRWIAMSWLLKKYRAWKDGLAFGLGHGGLEMMLIGGAMSIQPIVFTSMQKAGTLAPLLRKLPHTAVEQVEQLMMSPNYYFLLIGIERIFALILHIALSILVLYGIKKGQKRYLLYAISLHALADFPAALYQAHAVPILLVEGLLIPTVLLCLWYIRYAKKQFSGKED